MTVLKKHQSHKLQLKIFHFAEVKEQEIDPDKLADNLLHLLHLLLLKVH